MGGNKRFKSVDYASIDNSRAAIPYAKTTATRSPNPDFETTSTMSACYETLEDIDEECDKMEQECTTALVTANRFHDQISSMSTRHATASLTSVTAAMHCPVATLKLIDDVVIQLEREEQSSKGMLITEKLTHFQLKRRRQKYWAHYAKTHPSHDKNGTKILYDKPPGPNPKAHFALTSEKWQVFNRHHLQCPCAKCPATATSLRNNPPDDYETLGRFQRTQSIRPHRRNTPTSTDAATPETNPDNAHYE